MATPAGTAAAARQAASGYALRALPRRKTYTTSWDINHLHSPKEHNMAEALAAGIQYVGGVLASSEATAGIGSALFLGSDAIAYAIVAAGCLTPDDSGPRRSVQVSAPLNAHDDP